MDPAERFNQALKAKTEMQETGLKFWHAAMELSKEIAQKNEADTTEAEKAFVIAHTLLMLSMLLNKVERGMPNVNEAT